MSVRFERASLTNSYAWQQRGARVRARTEGGAHGATYAHQLGVVLLQHARVVRVGVGHGDHRVALCAHGQARLATTRATGGGGSSGSSKPPVCEKHESSTPVMRTPSAIGKVDLCAPRVILCRTTDLRSPGARRGARGERARAIACRLPPAAYRRSPRAGAHPGSPPSRRGPRTCAAHAAHVRTVGTVCGSACGAGARAEMRGGRITLSRCGTLVSVSRVSPRVPPVSF